MPTRLLLPTFLLFFLLSFAPAPVHAATSNFLGPIIPPECNCEGAAGSVSSAPALGCALGVTQNVINFFISFACAVAALAFAYAGFLWILNPTNPEMRAQGRTMLINIAIGLAIVLSAWLIIDFVMKKIYNENATVGAGGAKLGPWNSILNSTGTPQCIAVTTPQPIQGLPTLVAGITNGATGASTQGSGATSGTTSPTAGPVATGGAPTGSGGHFTYDSNNGMSVAGQMSLASAPLASLLSCMQGRVNPGVGRVSAIADSVVQAGTKTMAQCEALGQPICKHHVYSCHYGGPRCTGASYAVDFGDEEHTAALKAAAKSCNAGTRWNFEGNHVHLSLGAANGCGCDTNMAVIQ